MNMRVFLDASVLVAAVLSSKGGSFRVVSESGIRGFILMVSPYAYREAEAALEGRYERYIPGLHHLAASVFFVADVPPSEAKRFSAVIDEKDAPVFAAAWHARAEILLTLDKKHFLENEWLPERFPRPEAMTPGDFIKKYFV